MRCSGCSSDWEWNSLEARKDRKIKVKEKVDENGKNKKPYATQNQGKTWNGGDRTYA